MWHDNVDYIHMTGPEKDWKDVSDTPIDRCSICWDYKDEGEVWAFPHPCPDKLLTMYMCSCGHIWMVQKNAIGAHWMMVDEDLKTVAKTRNQRAIDLVQRILCGAQIASLPHVYVEHECVVVEPDFISRCEIIKHLVMADRPFLYRDGFILITIDTLYLD